MSRKTPILEKYSDIRSLEWIKSGFYFILTILSLIYLYHFGNDSLFEMSMVSMRARLRLITYFFIIIVFIRNTIYYFFKIDSIQIGRQIRKFPERKDEIMKNLEEGRLFATNTADSFLVSSKFCMIYCYGHYHLVRTRDIRRLGSSFRIAKTRKVEMLVCLMKNGNVYRLDINDIQARLIADELKFMYFKHMI